MSPNQEVLTSKAGFADNTPKKDDSVIDAVAHERKSVSSLQELRVTLDVESNVETRDRKEEITDGIEEAETRQNTPRAKGQEHENTPRIDEYEVNFDDTRQFAVSSWEDILTNATERLNKDNLKLASSCQTGDALHKEIQSKLNNPSTTQFTKRHLQKIHFLPQAMSALAGKFSNLVNPLQAHFNLVWGLFHINLEFSYTSQENLRRTSDLMIKIRRITETFNRSLGYCDETSEAVIAIVEFLDPLIIILIDSITYFHDYPPGAEAVEAWQDLSETIRQQLFNLETTVKHVNDINSYSKFNQERKARHLSLRHALTPEFEENGSFPIKMLPFRLNPRFYGRKNELDKIVKHLSPKDDGSLRTYTIYGRRGIGKTEIALQFAHKNPSGYDAVFWIACNTSIAIRESFTAIAKALKLPGAEGNLPHEENLLKVHNWLKRTRKKWLLIFDNAEKEAILQPYWPVGASGAILITSRQYFNFSKDVERKGGTIKPFNQEESYELLFQLLGDEWQKNRDADRIPPSEVNAAKAMLGKLEGLALAIRQAATLIADPNIGGPTIAMTYELFKKRNEQLQIAHMSSESSSIRALNSLWDMTFRALSPETRALLGVLAWFSPDTIPVQLFLPVEQRALEPVLTHFQQDARIIDANGKTLAINLVQTKNLQDALAELVSSGLLKNDNTNYSIHRVVQEAVNYTDDQELQASYDTACRLVYEQFPKTDSDSQLFGERSACAEYIAHGVYLSKKFTELVRHGRIKGSKSFVKLLTNCAQYLYESGDFDTTKKILDCALLACEEKNGLLFAGLRTIAGHLFLDLNRLADCRKAWTEALKIRKTLLPADAIAVASIYHNLGNLELADGDTEEALIYLERANKIYGRWGDTAAEKMALAHLCIGRVQMFKGQLDAAMATTNISEALFKHTSGSDKGFMVNVHYAYGNIYYRKKQYELAIRSYEDCLQRCQFTKPIHPITIAIWFSLGCVAFDMNNRDVAKAHLDRAKEIAELRNPRRDDGTIARINYLTSKVLESYPDQTYMKIAMELRDSAMVARTNLLHSGEGGRIPIPENEDADTYYDEDLDLDDHLDREFDALVPLFYR